MILELTPRLSGGWDSALSTPERGADFIGGALRLALGEKLDEEIWQNYFAYRKPERAIAVLAQVRQEAQDCIGREFAWGAGPDCARVEAALSRVSRGAVSSVANPKFAIAWATLRANFGFKATLAIY